FLPLPRPQTLFVADAVPSPILAAVGWLRAPVANAVNARAASAHPARATSTLAFLTFIPSSLTLALLANETRYLRAPSRVPPTCDLVRCSPPLGPKTAVDGSAGVFARRTEVRQATVLWLLAPCQARTVSPSLTARLLREAPEESWISRAAG